jgi:Neurotransmitter-gated ion-channel ligand binding domain
MTHYEILKDNLLKNYNPNNIPLDNNMRTNVTMEIWFSSMRYFELESRFELVGTLVMIWFDHKLRWNPAEHNNLDFIVCDSEKVGENN